VMSLVGSSVFVVIRVSLEVVSPCAVGRAEFASAVGAVRAVGAEVAMADAAPLEEFVRLQLTASRARSIAFRHEISCVARPIEYSLRALAGPVHGGVAQMVRAGVS
jgi:hypothetical protein